MTTSTKHRAKGDGAAALVEMALVLPILLLLVFGVMEMGWAFSQNLDVRHGARETARLAAVNYGSGAGNPQSDSLIAEGCDRMDDDGITTIKLNNEGNASGAPAGSRITVTVTRPLDTLTGFLDFALGGVVLKSDVDTRAERPLTWLDRTQPCT
jgi:Flp pilus assembly protein TadG